MARISGTQISNVQKLLWSIVSKTGRKKEKEREQDKWWLIQYSSGMLFIRRHTRKTRLQNAIPAYISANIYEHQWKKLEKKYSKGGMYQVSSQVSCCLEMSISLMFSLSICIL